MSDQHVQQQPPHPHEDTTTYELDRMLRKLYEEACHREIPAEFRSLPFNGGQGIFEVLDDVGAPALSYGVINPTAFKAYLNVAGGKARAGHAIEIPPKRAMILPIPVSGHIMLGLDEGELGVQSATIHRLRFRTVQPFFVGSL